MLVKGINVRSSLGKKLFYCSGLRIECPEGTYKFMGADVLELNDCEKEQDRKFVIKAK